MTHSLMRLVALALLTVRLVGAAHGQDIGTVTGSENTSWLNRGAGWLAAANTMQVAIGNALRTDTGRLGVLVFPEHRPGDRSTFVLDRQAELTIVGMSDSADGFALVRTKLDGGRVKWLGPGQVLAAVLAVRAPAAAQDRRHGKCAAADAPEFIVQLHESGVAEVVVLHGTVDVWNRDLDRAPIAVGAGQRTRVEPGWPPTEPENLSPEALQQIALPFQFVGGGVPEGQASNGGLITGTDVLAPERAVFRDPATPPGEDHRRERAESPPFDQPQPLVTSPELGVDF